MINKGYSTTTLGPSSSPSPSSGQGNPRTSEIGQIQSEVGAPSTVQRVQLSDSSSVMTKQLGAPSAVDLMFSTAIAPRTTVSASVSV